MDIDVFGHAMNRLSHRGPDGQDVFVDDYCAMGHWHFWTTPEELGEHQPLKLDNLPFHLVFDGRLDNRDELFLKLSIPPAEQRKMSDAALVLLSYASWSECCVEYFVGEFAFALYDESQQSLFCARDPLGDRTLFYSWTGSRLSVASEPWAVQAAHGSPVELDEQIIAHFFMIHAAQDGQTLFKNVLELLPAHRMLVERDGTRLQRYWKLDLQRKISYKTEEEYIAHFYDLLEASVRCCMRATTPVSVMMSGGMDSTSVACLSATMSPQPVTTISFTYHDLPGADESRYIDAISERWNTRSIKLVCDEMWPFREPQNWSRNPNQPEYNVFWSLNDKAYQQAHAEGTRVMLTGMYGDDLYHRMMDWLFELLQDGFIIEAVRGTLQCIRMFGFRRNWRAGYLQNAVKKFFGMFRLPIRRRKTLPVWLTPYAMAILQDMDLSVFENDYKLTGAWVAERCSHEIFNASLHDLELRNPYRDRRLVEFMMAIPSYLLFRHCETKHILRAAMKPLMPDLVRLRNEQTSFLPLFQRGLEREQAWLHDRFRDDNRTVPSWQKYIRQGWIASRWKYSSLPGQSESEPLITWLCLAYDSWYKKLTTASYK
jgi:asparagine synthase (glutamine-hydrolysing)